MKNLLILLPALTLSALLAACSTSITGQPYSSVITTPVTPTPASSSYTDAERAFLAAYPNNDPENALNGGYAICTSLAAGISRDAVVAQVANNTNKIGYEDATRVVNAAMAHLCPDQIPQVTTAAAPAAPPRELSSRDWAVIAKSPDSHIGERIIVFGKVTQFDTVTGPSAFRANVDGERQARAYEYDTNAILQGDAGLLADIVSDDVFRAEVTVMGSYSYTTTLGGTLTVPQLQVTAITRI
jgi:hypothetical protein